METIRFEEHNDWEGETWYFYMKVTPEMKERLREFMLQIEAHTDSYAVNFDKTYTHDVIKILIENDDDNHYMAKHNYVGELTSLPEVSAFADGDPFYKGQISNFCTVGVL